MADYIRVRLKFFDDVAKNNEIAREKSLRYQHFLAKNAQKISSNDLKNKIF